MTNTNESSMQKMMREKTRQEHKQAVQDYAKKGFDNGYNLRSYMQMIDVIGGPKDAEEYTEICEDFMEPVSGNIHAEQNLVFVDPIKYKINESQYIRIFKTPLSIDGRLFILVKPKEHKLSKKTYYKLAKIAVSAEHYLARANIDDTAGPTYAKQMALVDPEFLEPGKYKEICIYAAKANYRALKWMQYGKLSKQDFIDVFMATATHWHAYKWNGMNPAVFNLLDSDCPHSIAFTHQIIRKKTGSMTHTTEDFSAEHSVLVADHHQLTIKLSFIVHKCNAVHMHQHGFVAHLDFPFVTSHSTKVVKNRELILTFVIPIHNITFLINIFISNLLIAYSFVIECIGLDYNNNIFMMNGSVGGNFQMLVSEASVIVHNLIIPFVTV